MARSDRQLVVLIALAVLPYVYSLATYYYYDDGRLLSLARQAADGQWEVIGGRGFNGHFRPLPIASLALVYGLFGAASPVPFHVLSLILHVANVLLAWLLLRRLLGSADTAVAFGAACLFAAHWQASEAVTYLSAIGVLWSALGGLLACHGAVDVSGAEPRRGWALIAGGVLLSLAGGEYGVATWPLVLVCAASRVGSESASAVRRRTLAVCLVTAPLYVLYVVGEFVFADGHRIGQSYRLGRHVLRQLADNVARLTFPSAWLDEWLCFSLVSAAVVVGVVALPRVRRRLADRASLLLLAGGLGALLPFAPSLQGNYGRFLYIAAPFFLAWLLGLILAYAEQFRRGNVVRTGPILASICVLVVANVIHLEVRVAKAARRGRAVRALVTRVEQVTDAHPNARMRLWMVNHDTEAAADTCRVLGILGTDQIEHRSPVGSPPQGEVWILADYGLGRGFLIDVLVPVAGAPPAQGVDHRAWEPEHVVTPPAMGSALTEPALGPIIESRS